MINAGLKSSRIDSAPAEYDTIGHSRALVALPQHLLKHRPNWSSMDLCTWQGSPTAKQVGLVPEGSLAELVRQVGQQQKNSKTWPSVPTSEVALYRGFDFSWSCYYVSKIENSETTLGLTADTTSNIPAIFDGTEATENLSLGKIFASDLGFLVSRDDATEDEACGDNRALVAFPQHLYQFQLSWSSTESYTWQGSLAVKPAYPVHEGWLTEPVQEMGQTQKGTNFLPSVVTSEVSLYRAFASSWSCCYVSDTGDGDSPLDATGYAVKHIVAIPDDTEFPTDRSLGQVLALFGRFVPTRDEVPEDDTWGSNRALVALLRNTPEYQLSSSSMGLYTWQGSSTTKPVDLVHEGWFSELVREVGQQQERRKFWPAVTPAEVTGYRSFVSTRICCYVYKISDPQATFSVHLPVQEDGVAQQYDRAGGKINIGYDGYLTGASRTPTNQSITSFLVVVVAFLCLVGWCMRTIFSSRWLARKIDASGNVRLTGSIESCPETPPLKSGSLDREHGHTEVVRARRDYAWSEESEVRRKILRYLDRYLHIRFTNCAEQENTPGYFTLRLVQNL